MKTDLRFALRGLRRSPGFALAAIVTLALGIAAINTVFTIINGALQAVLLIVAIALAVVALLACLIPVRRALAVDPSQALRKG